jgi:alpha-L-arabinofuranosidase
LEEALTETVFLTGVERNVDVVIMAYVQWAWNMIWFDAKTAYRSPSYHVQKMYTRNMGAQSQIDNKLKTNK